MSWFDKTGLARMILFQNCRLFDGLTASCSTTAMIDAEALARAALRELNSEGL